MMAATGRAPAVTEAQSHAVPSTTRSRIPEEEGRGRRRRERFIARDTLTIDTYAGGA